VNYNCRSTPGPHTYPRCRAGLVRKGEMAADVAVKILREVEENREPLLFTSAEARDKAILDLARKYGITPTSIKTTVTGVSTLRFSDRPRIWWT